MDIISTLPPGIIETILCLLPIQEAARTCILSKEWMYRWTKIPKLEFIEDTFEVSSNTPDFTELEQTYDNDSDRREMTTRSKLFYAIYQVLLLHEGPIHEFTLCMEADDSCVEIDQIVRFLLKKRTLKKLKIDFGYSYKWFELPASLFSSHQLTELHVHDCALIRKRSFNEFGSLTTLTLESVQMHEKTLLRLLSNCPVLKKLTLYCCEVDILYTVGHTPIVYLFECFLMLESLSLRFDIVEFKSFVLDRVPKKLPTTFIHLKSLCMERMCFAHRYGIPFLNLLIKCSPNLEKLKLEIGYDNWLEEYEMGSVTIEEYSDIMLDYLKELDIRDFKNSDNELDFVNLVLAKSPVLKKVRIFTSFGWDEDEELLLNQTLLSFQCASNVVKIKVFARRKK